MGGDELSCQSSGLLHAAREEQVLELEPAGPEAEGCGTPETFEQSGRILEVSLAERSLETSLDDGRGSVHGSGSGKRAEWYNR